MSLLPLDCKPEDLIENTFEFQGGLLTGRACKKHQCGDFFSDVQTCGDERCPHCEGDVGIPMNGHHRLNKTLDAIEKEYESNTPT